MNLSTFPSPPVLKRTLAEPAALSFVEVTLALGEAAPVPRLPEPTNSTVPTRQRPQRLAPPPQPRHPEAPRSRKHLDFARPHRRAKAAQSQPRQFAPGWCARPDETRAATLRVLCQRDLLGVSEEKPTGP